MTKFYLTVVGTVLTYAAFIGFILPMLVSSETDEGPLLGLGIAILLPILFFFIGRSVYKQLKVLTKFENFKQDEKN